MAGSDFSIFVIVRNPFDVPITLHQVETHIPVELMDMNRARVQRATVRVEYTKDPGLVPHIPHIATAISVDF
jgi:hypothetical protein